MKKDTLTPETNILFFQVGNTRIGLNICEDIWFEDVTRFQSLKGDGEIIINISSSPYHMAKGNTRKDLLFFRASDNCATVIYVNQVGGQDELVFDGQSRVMGPAGEILATGKQFEEDFIVIDLNIEEIKKHRSSNILFQKRKKLFQSSEKLRLIKVEEWKEKEKTPLSPRNSPEAMTEEEEVYSALVLGLRDYVRKNGFSKAVLGLSGGIDSALSAANSS